MGMARGVLSILLLLSWKGFQIILAWEVANITGNNISVCSVPIGMESGWLENDVIQSKVLDDGTNHPGRARIEGDSAWMPETINKSQCLQIQMETITNISSILIQGHPTLDYWITEFQFSYSFSGFTWEHDPKIYKRGEEREITIIKLDKCITVRYIRIKPIQWHKFIALRLSIYGCFKEYTKCGTRFLPSFHRITRRIVGGNPTSPNSWPWVISFLVNGTKQYCGGSLISPSWILTAAHCFDSTPSLDDWKIIAGDHDLSRFDGYEVLLSTQNLYIHPNYTNGNETNPGINDVALIRLARPLRFHKRVHAVCLPDEDTVFPDGTPCYVTGWGHTKYNGSSSRQLREAVVKIIPKDICNSNYSFNDKMNINNICAGYTEGEIDSCSGDSGGPLVCENMDGAWVLTGIVNWGIECARPYKYGVYTEVRKMLPFIRDHLEDQQL